MVQGVRAQGRRPCLGGVDEIGQFTGGDVVIAHVRVFGGVKREVLVESVGGFSEQRAVVARNAPVGVEFDEDPGRAVLYKGAEVSPKLETLKGGRIGSGEIGIFDAGNEAEFAPPPIEAEGSLDHQQMFWAFGEGSGDTGPDGHPGAVRTSLTVLPSIVNRVDDADLSGVRGGGQGEVSIAAGGFEHGQFVIDTAVFALGVGVVECPVTVNKTIARLPVWRA